MTTRWEYARLSWRHTTNWTKKAPDEPQTYEHVFWIIRAGDEKWEKRTDTSTQALLDELGAEGWELVTETVRETTIHDKYLGWIGVGSPVRFIGRSSARSTIKPRCPSGPSRDAAFGVSCSSRSTGPALAASGTPFRFGRGGR